MVLIEFDYLNILLIQVYHSCVRLGRQRVGACLYLHGRVCLCAWYLIPLRILWTQYTVVRQTVAPLRQR